MENKRCDYKFIIALILNIAIVVMETYSLISYYLSDGLVMFRMFTEDSNILLLLSSLCFVVFGLIKIFHKSELPHFVGTLRYVATCTIGVTLVVIIIQVFFISKMADIEMFYQYEMIFHHTICPITCLLSFFCFEDNKNLKFRDTFFAIIPTFLYAIILIILNILKVTTGPYFFLEIYNQSFVISIMWFCIILSSSYVLCLLVFEICEIRKKIKNKQKQKP